MIHKIIILLIKQGCMNGHKTERIAHECSVCEVSDYIYCKDTESDQYMDCGNQNGAKIVTIKTF